MRAGPKFVDVIDALLEQQATFLADSVSIAAGSSITVSSARSPKRPTPTGIVWTQSRAWTWYRPYPASSPVQPALCSVAIDRPASLVRRRFHQDVPLKARKRRPGRHDRSPLHFYTIAIFPARKTSTPRPDERQVSIPRVAEILLESFDTHGLNQ